MFGPKVINNLKVLEEVLGFNLLAQVEIQAKETCRQAIEDCVRNPVGTGPFHD